MLKPVDDTALDYQGAITGLAGDVLHGWALDPRLPEVRLALEVYVDGVFATLVRADQLQPAWSVGDGYHGFATTLRRSWLEGASRIAVRIANQGPWLATLELPADAPAAAPAVGASQVWYPGGLKVTGWAWDPDDPARHVGITAREGETVLARAQADQPHPVLIHRPTADHGFTLTLPWRLADGEPHEVHLENDRGEPLAGSPIVVCTVPEGLGGLLRRHWPGSPQAPELALLARIADDQDRRAPRTMGLEHYPEWFAAFQAAPVTRAPVALAAGVMLYGAPDPEAEARTRESLAGQHHAPRAIEVAEPGGLPFAAHRLLAAGVDAIVPVRIGDRLAPHALAELLAVLAGDADALAACRVRAARGVEAAAAPDAPAWAYADNDCDGPDGGRTAPWLKPAWDLDLFLGADLVTPGAAFGADIVRAAFAAPVHPPGGDIHDFAAAIVEATVRTGARVAHLPRVLYHQAHAVPASPALAGADPDRQRAVAWLADVLAPGAQVAPHARYPGLLQVRWPQPVALPRVSLIVPTRDQYRLLHACIEGLLGKTDYPDLEVIVVDNDSTCPQTLAYLETLAARGVVVLRHPHPFNYAAINNRAVEMATGSVVGLVNNDIEVREPGWLRAMVAQLLQPGVGIVGAKLLWPNGMVQHAGVVVGINGLAGHIGNTWNDDDAGYLGLNHLARRQGAVTAACLLVEKALYEAVGGLDETDFPVTFNDVDFCWRMEARTGRAVVWTPLACLTHAESASRGKDHSDARRGRAQREAARLAARWRPRRGGAWYHPGLNLDWASGPYTGLSVLEAPQVSQRST